MLSRAFAAALALLVGGVLLWVVTTGPDGQVSKERRTTPMEKKAVRMDERLATNPGDKELLLRTMYAWISAGAKRFERIDTETQSIPSAVPEDYRAGLRVWNDYLKRTGGVARIDDAEYAGAAFFSLVEIGSTDPSEAEANAAGAARALRIACRHGGNLFNLSNLAVFEYFNGEFAAGDKAAKKAAVDVRGARGITPREVVGQLNEYKERGEKFVARVKRGTEELEETGEEELENPIKGYGAPAGINGYEPGDGPAPGPG